VTDWSILGGNPAPGTPATFDAIAQALGPIVDHGESSSQSIRAMAQQTGLSIWLGAAAEAFAESVHVIPTDLDDLVTAHQRAISALSDYSAALSPLQRQAAQALSRALSAQNDIDSSTSALKSAQSRYDAADTNYDYYSVRVDTLESEKRLADLVGDATEAARLAAEIATATTARNTAWTERTNASSDIGSARTARKAAEARLDDERSTANMIAGQVDDEVVSFVRRMTVAADFVVGQRSWFDRVRHDAISVADFNWRHGAEEVLIGTSHGLLRGFEAIDSFARAHAEVVHSVADIVNHYAVDVSDIANKVAPAFAAVGMLVESVSAGLPPPADAAVFLVGKDIASTPSVVAFAADSVGVMSAGVAMGADELADVPAAQRTAQFEADKTLAERSTTSLAFDGVNVLIAGVLPPIDQVPAQLAEGGATTTLSAVANYGAQTYVIPDAESSVPNALAPR